MAGAAVRLSQLLQGVMEIPSETDTMIAELASDSRVVRPGALFFALPGLRQDGRQFIPQASERGAVAVLCFGAAPAVYRKDSLTFIEHPEVSRLVGLLASRFFGGASAAIDLIGVTGTNGKSSVTHFIAQLLARCGQPCGVIGTLGYGFPDCLREASHTTPDTLRLHREIAQMKADGAKAVAMEVSSHALHQDRVAGLSFRGAVFTNLSRDHLDYHGDMQSYGDAKKRLFERPELKFAVVNLDDEVGREIASGYASKAGLLTFALENPEADLRVESLAYEGAGIAARVQFRGSVGSLRCRLIGDFNLSNVLAACGVLLSLGHPLEVVLNCAENLQPVAGRMQVLHTPGAPIVIVDYAHTPDALDQALRACALHQPSQIWCVFGCGGDRDRGKRPLMAAVVARHGARLVVTDDNPRTESPQQIMQDILAGVPAGVHAEVLHDREQAIAWAIERAGENDIVLIAGKGHEPYQEIHGVRKPFSDVVVASRILQLRSVQGVI